MNRIDILEKALSDLEGRKLPVKKVISDALWQGVVITGKNVRDAIASVKIGLEIERSKEERNAKESKPLVTSNTLYSIANEYAQLQNCEDFTAEEIADTLQGIAGEFSAKAAKIVHIIKSNNALQDAIKKEIATFQERLKSLESTNSKLKEYLATQMQVIGKTALDAGLHRVTLRKGSESVNVVDMSKVPNYFIKITESKSVDKNAVKEAVKAGGIVDGCEIVTGKPSLIIK